MVGHGELRSGATASTPSLLAALLIAPRCVRPAHHASRAVFA